MPDQRLSVEGLPRDIAHALTSFGNACFDCGAFTEDVEPDLPYSLVERQADMRRQLVEVIKAHLPDYPTDPGAKAFLADLRQDIRARAQG